MISQKDAILFADWIQEPVEFRNKVYSKDQNERICEYQQMAKFLSNDLKAKGITNLSRMVRYVICIQLAYRFTMIETR